MHTTRDISNIESIVIPNVCSSVTGNKESKRSEVAKPTSDLLTDLSNYTSKIVGKKLEQSFSFSKIQEEE